MIVFSWRRTHARLAAFVSAPGRVAASTRFVPALLCGWVAAAWLLAGAAAAGPESVAGGIGFLTASQGADGSWSSAVVRRVHATTEVMEALQAVGHAPSSRLAAAGFLEATAAEDTDDRARRIVALSGDGRNVTALLTRLRADLHPTGGWGLTSRRVASPLDTALALRALASQPTVSSDTLLALSSLMSAQRVDGGWACIDAGEDSADSDVYCTSHALLALAGYSSRFFITPELTEGVGYLKGRLNADGSFGPAGPDQVMNTSLAALALATLAALDSEVGAISGFLAAQQQADGSWRADAYTTALALRAMKALSEVPYCGDRAANRSAEACDGADLRGASCESLGLGTGTLSCGATCALDTRGCSGPPRCGDGSINVRTEACDGTDLAGVGCEALGLGPGVLRCNPVCKFDTTLCTAAPSCGDGLINQPGEACDGLDLGGLNCADSGFSGGTLRCKPDCSLDASQCTGAPFCGDGLINRPEEECDKLALGGRTCDSLGLGGGALTCTSTCKLQTAGCDSSGAAQPRSIVLGPESPVCSGQSQTVPVAINFPAGSVIDKVDVFLLFDDTGSFASTAPAVTGIFGGLVTELQTALPQVSFSFGVGRFEDYGGPGTSFSGESTPGRPFTLNQPLITPDVPSFLNLINAGLSRGAPGFGGDGPESNIEALLQVATGAGFDGNANGSTLDSGRAGMATTQVSPGTSGDVPPFSSNVAPTSGTLGGVGFRAGALHLVIQAGDICPIAAFAAGTPVPTVISGAGGVTVPTSALRCANALGSQRYGFVSNMPSTTGNTVASAVAPVGSATIPRTLAALNELGISVIGLAPGGVAIRNPIGPSSAPSVSLSAIALLTGATDATGNPLVFNISGGAGPIRDAIVSAVTTAATRPRDVTLAFAGVPAGLGVSFAPQVVQGVGPGGKASFNVVFTGDGRVLNGTFKLEFVDQLSNARLASVPVKVGCLPVPPVEVDQDGDGTPAGADCDDTNPHVHPRAPEIPGNGIDDDCNPGTPDELPLVAASCSVAPGKLTYSATDQIALATRVSNLTADLSLAGLSAMMEVRASSGGSAIFGQSRLIPTLAPGGRSETSYGFAALNHPPGEYTAVLKVQSGTTLAALCSAVFRIESSAVTGAGLRGTLRLDPAVVNAGSSTNATYGVTNGGNDAIASLGLKVLLVDPDTNQVVGQLNDTTSLAREATHTATKPFSTVGLAQKTYLAILIAVLPGTGREETLATARLTVVNEPPDCSRAVASPGTVFWAPNHQFSGISITGVTDPDGDPVTTTLVSVFQDEPTDELGDGLTCPDARGTGTPLVEIRAERSGRRDGRVYHVEFVGDDGRGGTCRSVIKVCVPHDRRPGSTCVDQGPLFNSTVCR